MASLLIIALTTLLLPSPFIPSTIYIYIWLWRFPIRAAPLSHQMAATSRLLRLNAAGRWMSSVVAESGIACPPSVARKGVVSPRDPACPSVQWVFLGCPGVGKGTYASRLSRLLGVPHIATGDLVRDELASSGPLSKQVFACYLSFSPLIFFHM